MNSVTAWSTEDQVLETLKKLSNGRRGLGNLDNTYLVKGDKPPPILIEEEDEEMWLHFGDSMHAGKDAIPDNTPPDLQGITNLLRLVQGSDEEGDNEDIIGQRSNCVIAISKASKLNPNVKEFTPKSTSISDTSVHSSGNGEITDPIATEVEKVTESVTEDLKTKLKNHISYAAKSNCFELKKQKNLAIATLLRMYATNNETPSARKPDETLKLITPDFFENRKSPVNVQSGPNDTSLPSASTSPGPKSMTSISHASSSNDVKSEPALSTRVTTKKQKPEQDPAIKTSINKVNQWLGEQPVNQTVQRKSPAVFIGPITYKAKEPAVCKSPKIPETQQQKVTKAREPNEYQPTNYADDLKNKYMDRINSKKVKTKRNMWQDLHEVLKEKDVLVKKKLEQGSVNSSDSDAPRRN
ncbi:unnamed protein product [Arctia plantaginis]|uniref:Uncharacterized protein n=1 Tax=Arctia plantaginis TaxID=874455 RepID=A0A8S1B4Q4_ARCPL|nr:unnamed protein product [Arctia plantaginis]